MTIVLLIEIYFAHLHLVPKKILTNVNDRETIQLRHRV